MWLTELSADLSLKNKKIFTMDIDWAPEFVLEDFYEILVRNSNTKFSIFHTHDSLNVRKISELENVRSGIHPNFNFLLQGDTRYGRNVDEVLDYYENLFPDCRMFRSHDLMHKTGLLKTLAKRGYVCLSNIFVPFNSGDVRPFSAFGENILNIPISFEDDEWIRRNEVELVDQNAAVEGVLNFHPIHIYLNSNSFSSYEKCKHSGFDETFCYNQRKLNTEFGVRDLFLGALQNS